MKKKLLVLFQLIIVLIGVVAIIILIRFPLTEGRAAHLDLFSIYLDPFILYGYAASVLFFIALYKAFKLLGYIRQNNAFSLNSVKALKSIKYCALLLCILIVAAGLYIKLFHNKEDDPAGFLGACTVLALAASLVAIAAAKYEKRLQNGRSIISEMS